MSLNASSGNDGKDAAEPNDPGIVLDPYAILGVSRDASYELIRRMYREKAKHCHPDLGSEPGREEEFKLLNWAHRIVGEQHREFRKNRSSFAEREAPAATGGTSAQTAGSPLQSPNAEILEEGRDRLRLGVAAEAERLSRLALQRFHGDTAAYVLLSEALAAQERYAEAVGSLLIALQLDRNCAEARAMLVRLQERGKHV